MRCKYAHILCHAQKCQHVSVRIGARVSGERKREREREKRERERERMREINGKVKGYECDIYVCVRISSRLIIQLI